MKTIIATRRGKEVYRSEFSDGADTAALEAEYRNNGCKVVAIQTASAFSPRATMPTETSSRDSAEPYYIVWGDSPTYLEDPTPWKVGGAFTYLQDALDYIAAQQDRGQDVVFQSPADCKLVKATDRRVVYRPEGAFCQKCGEPGIRPHGASEVTCLNCP